MFVQSATPNAARAQGPWTKWDHEGGLTNNEGVLTNMTDIQTGGRLAQVIATRGGLAPPEAPFVIEHREALYYMLCEAAELEHGIMCQYLYAAFSLKQSEAEGLSAEEAQAVQRWRKRISHIATQEMLHLSLVQNLLAAIGGAPHLSRPNFPHPATHYPAGVHLALLPFGEPALQHFMFLERPEGMDLDDAEGMAAWGQAAPAMQEGEIVPRSQDFKTVGHLYRSIEAGIAHLAGKFGERRLFVGPPRAQATQQYFGWSELVAVTDAASAQQAIDEILEQGEGPRGNWKDAHFGQFVQIMDEYTRLREANPAFAPARPVVTLNVRPSEHDTGVPLVTDPMTRQVMDLFNVSYEVLLLMLQRFFAHTEETDAQLQALADASVNLMFQAIKPIGDLVTTLPAGPDYPGRTAGPSFELFYETDCVLPHRESAWILLTERIRQAAEYCEPGSPCTPEVAADLDAVRSSLNEIARSLEAHLPARDRETPIPAPAEPVADLLARALDFYRTGQSFTGHATELLSNLGDLIRSVYPLVQVSQSDAATVARLVNSVLRPLAEALPAPESLASEPPEPKDAWTLWDAALHATRLRARYGRSAPPGLLEATAALQDLAVRQAPPSERAKRLAALADQMENAQPGIMTAKNGPYLVTKAAVVRDHLGQDLTLPPQLALCRCGASAMKPFCDATCATNGFTDDKDPKRVPDRRDTYPGEQVTIFDNRGICQHSGLCSDRLPTAFRPQAETYVAPSGARMDELVRAVRDCPSGALSLAFDDVEGRDLVDWHGVREQAIEITQDGPYRVTGGLPLTDAAGADVPRAAGSSREHYALCRCGHSRNKPFCSGMHWYVEFRDPPRDAEPTLFEWAGGLPALRRLTRMLYERHVPADDLLAPLFAGMGPDQPRREAAVIAEAFGGPAATQANGRPGLTEEQRARWVALAIRSADEAKLPPDPQFRAALSSYLEWTSRAADAPPPAWDWGPAGPPPEKPAQTAVPANTGAGSTEEVTLPGPDETVSFAANIKPLFREHDRQSMSFAFDLWSYDDVRAHADDILSHLQDGTMPCDGEWPAGRIEVFKRWTESGFQP
jgi:CDGSH-type Zn-finger protein/truncated hemoglobin YjbI